PVAAAFRAYDSRGDRRQQAKRITYRDYPFAHLKRFRTSKRYGRANLCNDLVHGKVRRRIGSDERWMVCTLVVNHLKPFGRLHHVVVSNNVAVGSKDHARACTDLGAALAVSKEPVPV